MYKRERGPGQSVTGVPFKKQVTELKWQAGAWAWTECHRRPISKKQVTELKWQAGSVDRVSQAPHSKKVTEVMYKRERGPGPNVTDVSFFFTTPWEQPGCPGPGRWRACNLTGRSGTCSRQPRVWWTPGDSPCEWLEGTGCTAWRCGECCGSEWCDVGELRGGGRAIRPAYSPSTLASWVEQRLRCWEKSLGLYRRFSPSWFGTCNSWVDRNRTPQCGLDRPIRHWNRPSCPRGWDPVGWACGGRRLSPFQSRGSSRSPNNSKAS